jgi:DNA-binding MarR family transcriptional regulator
LSRKNPKDEYLTDAEYHAWDGCLNFANQVTRALDEALSSKHRITVKEFDVLITLYNAPDGKLRMSELAAHVVLSASGVTHLVTRLERDRLVQRSVAPDDRRSFFVELTPEGRRRLRESRPTHNEVVRSRLTDQLTAPQLASLGTIFDTLLGRSRSAR